MEDQFGPTIEPMTRFRLLLAAAFAAIVLMGVGPLAHPAPAAAATTLDTMETTILGWINAERTKLGLVPLRVHSGLVAIANDRAAYMASTQVMKLARSHHPDVIVLDLHQEVDGRELLADLKRDPSTCDIKVVMLTGEEDQLTRHECFHLGAEDYFTKPLDTLFFRRLGEIAGLERGPD